jgi:hypothetical protein
VSYLCCLNVMMEIKLYLHSQPSYNAQYLAWPYHSLTLKSRVLFIFYNDVAKVAMIHKII